MNVSGRTGHPQIKYQIYTQNSTLLTKIIQNGPNLNAKL